jgi:hypothetical protein
MSAPKTSIAPARWFRGLYGAGPVHLLGLLSAFAVAAIAIYHQFDTDATDTKKIFLWMAGSVIGHDLVFLPLYSLADRLGTRPGPRWRREVRHQRFTLHLRVPVVLSGLMLLVFFPLILRVSPGDYGDATSLSPNVYRDRWLTATAVLFGVSAVLYVLRVVLDLYRRRGQLPPPPRAQGW